MAPRKPNKSQRGKPNKNLGDVLGGAAKAVGRAAAQNPIVAQNVRYGKAVLAGPTALAKTLVTDLAYGAAGVGVGKAAVGVGKVVAKTSIPARVSNLATYKEFTSMPVSKFQKKYNVSSPYEGRNWKDLVDDEGFMEGPIMSRVGSIDGGDMAKLTADIAERGILKPIKVAGKNVIDGHHRVVAARDVGPKTRVPVQRLRKIVPKRK